MPAGLGNGYSYYLSVIDDYLNMGYISDGNLYLENYTIYQHCFDSNNGDVSGGYGF